MSERRVGAVYLGLSVELRINLRRSLFDANYRRVRQIRAMGTPVSGDWPRMLRYLETLYARLKTSLHHANMKVAQMYYHDINHAWQSQTIRWRPLKASTRAYKAKHNLDPRTLIASRHSLEHLGIHKKSDLLLDIGVEETDDTRYMLFHEFGSPLHGIPARPLFRPVFMANVDRYVAVYHAAIETALEGGTYR